MIPDDSDPPRRIVSFLPSATEMVCALGLANRLVGITHECDYPPEVRGKPVVVRFADSLEGCGPREIDEIVRERLRSGASFYEADERLLRKLAPDLIVAQDLCQVCAPSGNEISRVLRTLPRSPEILYMTPKRLADIFENLRELGRVTGREWEAERLIAQGQARLMGVERIVHRLASRPRVFCMEWLDPIYCSGHWVPEMVELAGGHEGLGRNGLDSVRILWQAVQEWSPEILILSPCGSHLPRVLDQAPCLFAYPNWQGLPAVRTGRVYAVDASSYFARPGPRIVDGVELLAHLLHPESFSWRGPMDAYRQMDAPFLRAALAP